MIPQRHDLVRWALATVVLALPSFDFLAAQDPDLTLRVRGPAAELKSGAEFDASVLLDTAVEGVQGWSLGVAHDPAVLQLLTAVAGPSTLTANDGARPDFLVLKDSPAVGTGVTMAVVIAFTMPVTLPIGNGYDILDMGYRVVADPTLVDPCVPIQGAIAFSNVLGDPPVATVVTVSGSTRTPTTVDAPITVRCPGTLEITRCEGDTENVYLEWELGGTPGWDFLFLYRDGDLLATLASDATSYTDEGLEPGDYVYTLVTFVVDDPAEPQLVFTYCTGTVIPVTITSIEPSMGYWIGGDTVTVRGTAFTSAETTTLSFFDAEQTLPLQVTEIVSPEELRAVTPASPRLGRYSLRIQNERGSAELPDSFEYGFVRAEANADGKVDISDGIFILDFFYLGNAVPRCLDAVDTTDDAILDISDAIRIFSFLFLGGPPPPAPFAGPGRDPTPDPFGCLEEPQA